MTPAGAVSDRRYGRLHKQRVVHFDAVVELRVGLGRLARDDPITSMGMQQTIIIQR